MGMSLSQLWRKKGQEPIRKEASAADVTSAGVVDVDAFRSVMRQLAGSVTVITTETDGVLHGFTATAVCSVCATPPTILIVVNKSARTHPHIDRRGMFAVNILAATQKGIAEHFATKGDDQFSNVDYSLTANGVPLINHAAAHLECEIESRNAVGTHTIFIARVIGTGTEAATPLIYQDARYGQITYI